jgi:hypothetical protein
MMKKSHTINSVLRGETMVEEILFFSDFDKKNM